MPGKTGRPSKGPRTRFHTPLADPLAEIVKEAVQESAYKDAGDFLASIIADHFGREEYKPKPTRIVQREELPLDKTA